FFITSLASLTSTLFPYTTLFRSDPDFHRRELTLLSSRNSISADFRRIINYLEAGQIDLTPWITNQASADTMIAAFPRWFERDSGDRKSTRLNSSHSQISYAVFCL